MKRDLLQSGKFSLRIKFISSDGENKKETDAYNSTSEAS